MAGSISLSLSQQFDSLGEPLNGGLLYFFAAGTTTPQSAYQDVALTIPWPNPIVLDAAGRIPAFYLADGQIKIRLADAFGVTQVAADNLLVIGPSSGAGSPPSVDATKIFDAGDLKVKYGTGSITGWVRANGRTIGSGTSGASERANTDCQTLFEYLWTADSALVVSTGRGISANADWVANKTIALPDWRGRALAGLDDMGNSAAGRLTATYFGTAATVLGAAGGGETGTLANANQIPTLTSVNASQAISVTTQNNNIPDSLTGSSRPPGGGATPVLDNNGNLRVQTSTGNNSISVTYTNASPQPFRTAMHAMLATIYIKI